MLLRERDQTRLVHPAGLHLRRGARPLHLSGGRKTHQNPSPRGSHTSIATAGIGDEPGSRLVHPPVRFAKLNERVLIQMLVHGQMVQMVPYIIRIAGLRVDTVHLIVKLSQEMLGRLVTSKVSRPVTPPWARARVPGRPTDARCTRVRTGRSGRGAALPKCASALRPAWDAR
jgi:hypothetical protein